MTFQVSWVKCTLLMWKTWFLIVRAALDETRRRWLHSSPLGAQSSKSRAHSISRQRLQIFQTQCRSQIMSVQSMARTLANSFLNFKRLKTRQMRKFKVVVIWWALATQVMFQSNTSTREGWGKMKSLKCWRTRRVFRIIWPQKKSISKRVRTQHL